MSIPATCLLAHMLRVSIVGVRYNRFPETNEILALDRAKIQMKAIVFRGFIDDYPSRSPRSRTVEKLSRVSDH